MIKKGANDKRNALSRLRDAIGSVVRVCVLSSLRVFTLLVERYADKDENRPQVNNIETEAQNYVVMELEAHRKNVGYGGLAWAQAVASVYYDHLYGVTQKGWWV